MKDQDGPLLSISTVALRLGVSAKHLRALVKQRLIPSCSFGGRKVIPQSAYNAWLEGLSSDAMSRLKTEVSDNATAS